MNTFGKTIRLFLLEGNTNSLVTAELSNWTGIGIRVPKIKIKEYSSREEFQKQGVYILIGKGENNEDAAYIGEAEIVYDRLLSHIANKEFWNEVVFFCGNKYVNKASVKYLESRMHELATNAGRYKIEQNIPNRPELSEAEQAELEEFLANIKVLTSTLGYKIFETIEETIIEQKPKKTSEVTTTIEEQVDITEGIVFFCKGNNGINAMGTPSTEGFMVFGNSYMLKEGMLSMNESIRIEKSKMLEEGILVDDNGLLRLTRNYNFTSSSRAATIILGRSANGRMEWKTESGIPLKDFGV